MARLSRHITQAQARNLFEAIEFAYGLGLPLNRLTTILWQEADVVGRIQDAQARLLERMRKWMQYRGAQPAFVWVVENGREMGLHTHILLHVPSEHLAAWKRMLPVWVDGDVQRKTIHVKTIPYPKGPKAGLNSVKGVRKYLAKGISSQSAANFGIVPQEQGSVVGKRVGTSQNLGPAARSAFAQRVRSHQIADSTDQAGKIAVRDGAPARWVGEGASPNPLDIPNFLRRTRERRR